MRIAYFLNEFPSLSQTFVLNQITGMIDKGHEVDIYAGYRFETQQSHPQIESYGLLNKTRFFADFPKGYFKRLIAAIGLVTEKGLWFRPRLLMRMIFSSGKGRELLSMRSLYRALALADRGKYDVIHCQFGTLGPLALALRDIGVTDGAIVTSFRGYDITKQADNSAAYYKELFHKGAIFLPVSRSLREELLSAGCPADRLQVLHSGIDCRLFAFSQRSADPGSAIRLLTIGRLVEKKGIEYALAAVSAARKSGFDVHYTIVGDGPLKARLQEQIAARQLDAAVDLLGWCNHEEVVRLMGESHLLIAPSVTADDGDQEGIPNVVKEAMASGLPVLSTWHGGIPELVDDGVTGYLVPERDVAGLTEALTNFCSRPETWGAMGASARKKIEAEFDMHSINNDLEAVYLELAQNR